MSHKITKLNDGTFNYVFSLSKRSKIKSSIRSQKQFTINSKKELTSKQIKNYEDNLRDMVLRDLIEKESKGINFMDLADRWYDFEFQQMRLSRTTILDYYSSIKKWCYTIHNTEAEKITRRDMNIIFNRMEKEGVSKSHQQTVKTIINHVFNWGNNEGLIKVDHLPTRGIATKRAHEKVPEILTENQVREFLKQARELEHRWYPIWCMALLTGCRNGELYSLYWNDVNFETGLITIQRSYNSRSKEFKSTKSGDYRTVPINSDLELLLKELKIQNGDSKFVLPRIRAWKKGQQARELRTFLKCIGLPSVRFHTLRACFCTMLLSQGQKPAQIMKVCGWKNLKTMERYVRMAGVDEKGLTDTLNIMPQVRTGELLTGTFGNNG